MIQRVRIKEPGAEQSRAELNLKNQSLYMPISCVYLCFISFLLLFAIPSDCSHQVYPNKSLFIFGDSLFDPGNNNYINTSTSFQANFSPYGETFFKYPTGRFSDGRLVPDFIAEYANLPLIPTFLKPGINPELAYHGLNFASGGAGALPETYSGWVVDLKMQLRYFKNVVRKFRTKVGKKETKILVSNAVYLFSVGSNDYIFPFYNNSTVFKDYGTENFVEQVIGNITAVVKEIYKKGGRKFGFFNLGPLGCLPSARAANERNNGACVEEITAIAKLHNKLFHERIKKMEAKLEGFQYSMFDFFSTGMERLNNPPKFGFKEGKRACCGSGPYRGFSSCGGKREGMKEFELCDKVEEYLFFDSSHLTEAAYRQFAELMWNGNETITGPHNLKSLFHLLPQV